MSWIPTREKSTRSSNTNACKLCSNLSWVHKDPSQNLGLWTASISPCRDIQWVEITLFKIKPYLGLCWLSRCKVCLITAAYIRWTSHIKLVPNDISMHIDTTINQQNILDFGNYVSLLVSLPRINFLDHFIYNLSASGIMYLEHQNIYLCVISHSNFSTQNFGYFSLSFFLKNIISVSIIPMHIISLEDQCLACEQLLKNQTSKGPKLCRNTWKNVFFLKIKPQ